MDKILKVAKQEFKMTAANKAFVIITLLGPFLILFVSVMPTFLNTNIQQETTVALLGVEQPVVDELNLYLKDTRVSLVSYNDDAAARADVRAVKIQGYINLPGDYFSAQQMVYYSKTGTDMVVYETVRGVLSHYIVTKRLFNAGIDPSLVQSLSAQPDIAIKKLAAEGSGESDEGFISILMTGISFIMLIYMTVLLYGQLIARSVVLEKTSKTVEIMLSSVTPRQMMYGKILGIGLAGLIQYTFWIGLALVMVKIIGPALHLAVPGTINLGNLLYMLLFFIIAYFLYAALYVAIGAAAEDEQHVGQLGMPLIIFLALPMVLVSSIIMDPSSLLSAFLSYFPLTAPIVMFARVLVAAPPAWEIILSVGIVLLTILLVVNGAAKIFRVGILMTGKRFKLGEILKWVRVR